MEYNNGQKPINPLLVKETGWTVEEYHQLPEDGNQYELVGGKLELMTSPSSTHQRICSNMAFKIKDTCVSEYIILFAPLDLILSDIDTRQPDILMIHRSRENIIAERGIIGPPDLVVEILSPSTAKRDRTMKLASYAAFDVPEYWIADPAYKTIEQYVQTKAGEPYILSNVYGAEDRMRSDTIRCASFSVNDVFTF